jgi:hypothetical protein
MEALIVFFTQTVIGIILLSCVILGCLFLIVFAILRGYTFERDENGKLRFFREEKEKKKKSKDENNDSNEEGENEKKSLTVQETPERINTLVDNSIKDLFAIKNKYKEENRKAQKEALNKAIGSITLSYTQKLNQHENAEKMTEILELYLKRDFNTIMSEKLDNIRKSSESGAIKKDDILNNISKYTDSILIDIKSVVIKFDLIDDKSSLYNLLEESKGTIKDTLEDVIKQFLSLNEKEQIEVMEIRNKRIEQITQELNILLGR